MLAFHRTGTGLECFPKLFTGNICALVYSWSDPSSLARLPWTGLGEIQGARGSWGVRSQVGSGIAGGVAPGKRGPAEFTVQTQPAAPWRKEGEGGALGWAP